MVLQPKDVEFGKFEVFFKIIHDKDKDCSYSFCPVDRQWQVGFILLFRIRLTEVSQAYSLVESYQFHMINWIGYTTMFSV